MTIKKIKKLLTIDLLDNDPDELLLANYLKSNKNVKGQLLAAAKAHFRANALSEDPNNTDEDVELAILESLQTLWCQMNYIVDYHRIKRKIHLTPQSLMRFGLGTVTFERMVTPPQPRSLVPTLLPTQDSVVMVKAGKNRQSASNSSDYDDDDGADADILKDFCGDSDSLNLDL
jgi:hypothetical protein